MPTSECLLIAGQWRASIISYLLTHNALLQVDILHLRTQYVLSYIMNTFSLLIFISTFVVLIILAFIYMVMSGEPEGNLNPEFPFPILWHSTFSILWHYTFPILRHFPFPILWHYTFPILGHFPFPILWHSTFPILRHFPFPI